MLTEASGIKVQAAGNLPHREVFKKLHQKNQNRREEP
jgi:hypothetical protein